MRGKGGSFGVVAWARSNQHCSTDNPRSLLSVPHSLPRRPRQSLWAGGGKSWELGGKQCLGRATTGSGHEEDAWSGPTVCPRTEADREGYRTRDKTPTWRWRLTYRVLLLGVDSILELSCSTAGLLFDLGQRRVRCSAARCRLGTATRGCDLDGTAQWAGARRTEHRIWMSGGTERRDSSVG